MEILVRRGMMNFREFFSTSKFTLFATGNSNWDIFVMQPEEGKPCLVSLAKEGSGAKDSFFGKLHYFETLEKKGIKHGYTKV